MGVFRRQLELTSTVFIAVLILGGSQARAGYVSIPALAESDGSAPFARSPISSLSELDTPVGMGESATSSPSLPNSNDPEVPFGPSTPARNLLPEAFTFGQSSGAGSSSSSTGGYGPSISPAGVSHSAEVPSPELSSLLPPHSGDADPFSVASFLFRPPRAP